MAIRKFNLTQNGPEVQNILDRVEALDVATVDEDGLMSSNDKEKLNEIEAISTAWIDRYLI